MISLKFSAHCGIMLAKKCKAKNKIIGWIHISAYSHCHSWNKNQDCVLVLRLLWIATIHIDLKKY